MQLCAAGNGCAGPRVIYVVSSMSCHLCRVFFPVPSMRHHIPGLTGRQGPRSAKGECFRSRARRRSRVEFGGLHPGSVPRRDHATADLSPGAARTGASSAGLGLGFFRMSCHGTLKMDRPAPPVPVDAGAMMLDPQGRRSAALPLCLDAPYARPTLPGFMIRPNRGHRDDI